MLHVPHVPSPHSCLDGEWGGGTQGEGVDTGALLLPGLLLRLLWYRCLGYGHFPLSGGWWGCVLGRSLSVRCLIPLGVVLTPWVGYWCHGQQCTGWEAVLFRVLGPLHGGWGGGWSCGCLCHCYWVCWGCRLSCWGVGFLGYAFSMCSNPPPSEVLMCGSLRCPGVLSRGAFVEVGMSH